MFSLLLTSCREDLLSLGLMKDVVYRNAAGFLKFPSDPYATYERYVWSRVSILRISCVSNLLDSYKIHPEDYEYALKICRNAVDEVLTTMT